MRPGANITVVSGTKGQANIIIHDKIEVELMNMSPMLRREVSTIQTKGTGQLKITFKNGSIIKVVPASEYARGGRANIIVYEEFRLIKKSVIDNIIAPFLVSRQLPFMFDLESYGAYANELQEEPISVYISSAWTTSHWMWGLMNSAAESMFENGPKILFGLDYSIVLMHRIKTRQQLIDVKHSVDMVTWTIEYENRMLSDNTHAFFKYGMITPRCVLKKAWYPKRTYEELNIRGRYKNGIVKQDGEIRVVSCDIAMIKDDANDNSIYSCLRLLPQKEGSSTNTFGYHVQIPYIEHRQGGETTEQAIRIKQLFTDFEADYLVLDVRNAGISVFDALARVLYDDERDCEYPAWTSMNNKEMANRIYNPNAKPVIYCFSGYAKLNSDIAITLKMLFESGQIDILVNSSEGLDEVKAKIPEYTAAEDPAVQMFYESPYFETEALIHEMAALEYEVAENTGIIKVKEPRTGMKDRYVSVAMGCHFASLMGLDTFYHDDSNDYGDFSGNCISSVSFD